MKGDQTNGKITNGHKNYQNNKSQCYVLRRNKGRTIQSGRCTS